MSSKLNISRIWQIVQILICGIVVQARRPMTTEPHPHTGLNKPYTPGDPAVTFTKSQLKELQEGKMVQDVLVGDGGGRTIAVQEVHAPENYVWDRILDFENYAKMVPKVLDSYIYERGKMKNGTEIFKTFLQFGFFGFKFDSYIYHTYYPKKNTVTWTLDYTKKSTLGMLKMHPATLIRVNGAESITVPKWTPSIVKNYLSKVATREANEWVKAESEKKYNSSRYRWRFHGIGMPKITAIGAFPNLGTLTFGSGRDDRQVDKKMAQKVVEEHEWAVNAAKVGAQQLKLEQQQRRAQVVLTGLRTLLTIGVGYGSFMLLNRLKKPEEENSGNIISNNTNGGLTHNQHSSNTSI